MYAALSPEARNAPAQDLPVVAVSDAAAVPLQAAGDTTTFSIGVTVYNDGPNTAYIGGSAVTSARGIPVASGGTLDLWGLPSKTWARCATGQTASLRVAGA